MSDRVVFNTRERPQSTDQNNAQAMSQRDALDLMGGAAGLWQLLSSGVFLEIPRSVVLGGLQLSPSGANFAMSIGTLLQYSLTLVPTPGTYDSPYRLGANRSIATIVPPVVGAPTYYLLEAQVSEVTTSSESRDILDVGTFAFVPTLVPKVVQTQVVTQWVVGTTTNFPNPSGGDWVAIAGVLVTGAAPAAADIFDMRPLRVPAATAGVGIVDRRIRSDAGYVSSLNVETRSILYRLCTSYEVTPGATTGINFDHALTRDPTNLPNLISTSAFSYLYLVSWNGLAPVGQYAAVGGAATPTRFQSQGVLIFSGVAPSQGGNTNSAILHYPAPFNAATVPVGEAVCIACFSQLGTIQYSGNVASLNRPTLQGLLKSWTPIADSDTAVLTSTTLIPAAAKELDMAFAVTPGSGAGILMLFLLTSGAPGAVSGDVLNNVVISDAAAAVGNHQRAPTRCNMPVAEGQVTLGVTHSATPDDPNATLTVVGWKE